MLYRIVEDTRQDADRAVDHRGARSVSGVGRGPRLHAQAVHFGHRDNNPFEFDMLAQRRHASIINPI